MQYANRRNPLNLYRQAARAPRSATLAKFIVFFVGTACYTAFLYFAGGAKQIADPEGGSSMQSISSKVRTLSVTTWNIAAINNNVSLILLLPFLLIGLFSYYIVYRILYIVYYI